MPYQSLLVQNDYERKTNYDWPKHDFVCCKKNLMSYPRHNPVIIVSPEVSLGMRQDCLIIRRRQKLYYIKKIYFEEFSSIPH